MEISRCRFSALLLSLAGLPFVEPGNLFAKRRRQPKSSADIGAKASEALTPGADIRLVGVGGGGNNALNRMIEHNLTGVDFIAANTDFTSLGRSKAKIRLPLGTEICGGLGAGADPKFGSLAAFESQHQIRRLLQGSKIVFICAGLGGGTGTGAAPIVARVAKGCNALVVWVITKPFSFEGKSRMRQAEAGLIELKKVVDTLVVIPNDKLFDCGAKDQTFLTMFNKADEVIVSTVRCISDLLASPSDSLALDVGDVLKILEAQGEAVVGFGKAIGANRTVEAARLAIDSPWVREANLKESNAVLVNIAASPGETMEEAFKAVDYVLKRIDASASYAWGLTVDEKLVGTFCVSFIATFPETQMGPWPLIA